MKINHRGKISSCDKDELHAEPATSGSKATTRLQSKKFSLVVSLALGATILSACGSSSSASSTSTTNASSSSSSSSSSTGSSASSTLASQLKSLEAVPSFKAPGPSLNASKLSGKTVAVIDGDPAAGPVIDAANGITAAAKVAGLNLKLLNGQNASTSTYIQLLDEAIALKPVAIITLAVAPALVKPQLQQAKKDGIPVVVGLQQWHASPNRPDYFGFVTQPGAEEGTLLAEQIAADGPKNATVGFITSNVINLPLQIYNSFKTALAKYCPGCKIVDTQNVDPSNWVSSLTSTASSILSANPNLNYLIPVFDGMTPFIVSALGAASGHSVKVITTQGSTGAAIKELQNGTFTSDIGASGIWEGWAMVDQALRAGLNMSPESHTTLPVRVLNKSDLSGVNPNSDAAVYGTSYVSGFKKLWGLG